MSGLFSVSVAEARGLVAVPADIDQLSVVIGCSSAGVGLSPFYLSDTAAIAGRGYGDAVDALTQIIDQKNPSSAKKVPAAMYTVPATTVGAYGAIDVTGVTGTSVVTVHAATHPYGTYEAYLIVKNGGTIGVAGITLQHALDAGRSLSGITALGTATTFVIPNSNVQFDFAAGSLNTGDIVHVRTTGPAPAAADIDAAFIAIAASSIDFTIAVCEWDMTASLAAHVKTGLGALRNAGKRAVALCHTRMRNFEAAETEAVWATAVEADFVGFTDSNICVRAAYGFITDAVTGRQYLRSNLAQFAADVVRVSRSSLPDVPADQNMSNFILTDASGTTIGHDEGPRGAVTGLSNETLGNRFCSDMRFPDAQRREEVFSTVPWVMYAADERIRNLPVRRIANAIERVAVSAGTSGLGGKLFYIPAVVGVSGSVNRLTAASIAAIQSVIYRAVATTFYKDIQNASAAGLDTGLVQVDPVVGVSGGNLLSVNVTIAPRVFGILLSLNITLAIQE